MTTPHQPDSSIDVEALRKAAEAVESKVWHWHTDPIKDDLLERNRWEVVTLGRTITRTYYSDPQAEKEAAYIAAANPAVMIALLDERRALLDSLTHYQMAADAEAKFADEWRERAIRAEAAAGAVPEELFDGLAVYSELLPQERMRTSPENVSDALDAAVRILRRKAATPPAQGLPAAPGLVQAVENIERRDWTEDFTHENGNYMNTCSGCKQTFMGHKRRVICKVCDSAPPAAAPSEPTTREWIVKGEHFTIKLTDTGVAVAGIAPAISEPDATRAAPSEPMVVELVGVKRQLDSGAGFWHPCSGCYDTEDGHPTGPYEYSREMRCALGNGCSECGGLGAIWDNNDYAEYPEVATPPAQDAGTGALRDRIAEAWANYERMGEICSFEGEPMIYASTLREIAELANSGRTE